MSVEISEPDDNTFCWSLRLSATHQDLNEVRSSLHEAVDQLRSQGGGHTQLWIPEVTDSTHADATDLGFSGYRDLWQLRAPLPIPGQRSDLPVRAFDPLRDIDAFVEANARAFEWHPEQGQVSATDVRRSITEPWFSADGFLLHHIGARLGGYCWTKIHRDTTPNLGEIYVIAIDPDFHGRGLGGPMTRAGLDHLSDQGLRTAMLYVEADNVAANRVYERLGFSVHHVDRAYRAEL